jgi:hypothetical protein
MTHWAGSWPAVVHPASPVARPSGESFDAVVEDGGPAAAVDSSVYSAASAHGVVGGVDDRVDTLFGDVAMNGGDFKHACNSR